MSHYAIFEREELHVYPDYEDMICWRHGNIGFYDGVCDVKDKFESIITINRYGCINQRFLVNCIVHKTKGAKKVIHWEGELNLNELKIGDAVTIQSEVFEILDVNKNVNGAITYTVDNKYIKCTNYNELYTECINKYNENLKVLVGNLEKSNEVIETRKKSIWKRLFH